MKEEREYCDSNIEAYRCCSFWYFEMCSMNVWAMDAYDWEYRLPVNKEGNAQLVNTSCCNIASELVVVKLECL